MNKIEQAYRKEVYQWVKERLREYKDTQSLTCEIKLYKPVRTLTQNAFFHLLCTFLSGEMGYGRNSPEPVKSGIKEKYGYRMEVFGKLVPKPSHLCDKFQEMSALIEGCFLEAGDAGIDVKSFIDRWEAIKKQREKEIANEKIQSVP